MTPLNKEALVDRVAAATGHTKRQSLICINAFLAEIKKTLTDGGAVKLVGFGHLATRDRPSRNGRNPHTNTPIVTPATKVVVFRPGKPLKRAVNNSYISSTKP